MTYSSRTDTQTDWREFLENVYRGRNLYPFASGHEISMYPHEVWIVCRGVVQLNTIHSSGTEVILGVVGTSMPFGLPLTTLNPYQAIALSDVDLMRFSMAEVEHSPILSQGIFRHLIRRLQQTEAMLSVINHRRVEDRLKQLLLMLKNEVGQDTPHGVCLNIRLTHQHLANAISSTRVTVTRALGELQAEGWLSFDKNRYILIH
ncbi:cAMP-binding protein [Synechococcus sp. PCC 7502]|uniref:Crp/Fnr family transcriptional regulator n=1 Tax=Synechococcus sp. PCC 7502 TaxID=1173263 RepID=UPI00029F9D13|nr:Crp/Fnr family transcriptional regulator [Synechococcus sp. PCC 7502]AFY75327.1 cAMP-binding protein [Synechococcus sp. PCC 7502]